MPRKDYAWVFDPHSGGKSVPESMRESVRKKIVAEFERHGFAKDKEIQVKFRGAFCYVDAQEPGCAGPTQLFRLRYFPGRDSWSVAFFTYSNEQYQPCSFPSGKELGNPEDAVELARLYL